MPRWENPDFNHEEMPRKKDYSGLIMIAIMIFVFAAIFSTKDHPAGYSEYNVSNVNVVAAGKSSVNVHYIIDNWDIPDYNLHITYGDYDHPVLRQNHYETYIFGKFRIWSSQPSYTLYLPKDYKF